MKISQFSHALFLSAVLAIAGDTQAKDNTPGRLELAANFNTVSVYAFGGNDEASLDQAKLEYRSLGQMKFTPALPLVRTGRSRFAGSIFGLEPNQQIEVRVTAGAEVITTRTQTRSDKFPSSSGRILYVSAAGLDGGPATAKRPLKTIQHAVDQALPGDTIILAPGIWFENIRITHSGKDDAYITIRGSPEGTPASFITGGRDITGPWRKVSEKLFVTDESQPVNTIRQPFGAGRLYHHLSLAQLKQAKTPLNLGWFHDLTRGKLYVRLAEDIVPKPGQITAGKLQTGLKFDRSSFWIVENIQFHHFGQDGHSRGIEISNSKNIVVRNNHFAHMRTGISIRGNDSINCLIERNSFTEENIFNWPWEASKAHDVEGAAVALRGGRGNVVRYNYISGPFNGITVSTWGDLENEKINRDLDIHNNFLSNIADDALEPEGACMNVRFWSNRTENTLVGISLAPITVGPVYVIRDRYLDFFGKAVKVGNDSTGPVFFYHCLGFSDHPESAGIAGTNWSNVHLKNCIIRSGRYIVEDFKAHTSAPSFDYSCLFTSDPDRLIKWEGVRIHKAEGLPAESFGQALQFTEPYTSQTGPDPRKLSPSLIDAGLVIPGINDNYLGDSPDIGPDEMR